MTAVARPDILCGPNLTITEKCQFHNRKSVMNIKSFTELFSNLT